MYALPSRKSRHKRRSNPSRSNPAAISHSLAFVFGMRTHNVIYKNIKIQRHVRPQGGVQRQSFVRSKIDAFKLRAYLGRTVHNPLSRVRCLPNGIAPLPQTCFLTLVNLLASTDEAHNHCPLRQPFCEINEFLRLRSRMPDWDGMFFSYHVYIKGPLRFIKYDNMMVGNRSGGCHIGPDIIFDIADKSPAATTGTAQLVLKDSNERAIA